MDNNRGIGKGNRIPWHLSADFKHFKETTWGHHLIMGRKTYESIGLPLPGRTIIILSQNRGYQASNCLIAYSIEDALNLARNNGEVEVFIAGGAEIYAQTLELADRLYLTFVQTESDADVFFPVFDPGEWTEQESFYYPPNEQNPYPFIYKLLIRKSSHGTNSLTNKTIRI